MSSELEGLKIQLQMANDKAAIAEGRLSVAEGEKKALSDKAARLSDLLKASTENMTSAEMRLAGAEERAAAALRRVEEVKKEAELEVSAARKLQETAETRAALAETEAWEATAATSRAVADYKGSKDFEADVASAGISMFFTGFQECKLEVAKVFPSLDLSGVRPPGSEEEEEEGEEGDAPPAGLTAPPIPEETRTDLTLGADPTVVVAEVRGATGDVVNIPDDEGDAVADAGGETGAGPLPGSSSPTWLREALRVEASKDGGSMGGIVLGVRAESGTGSEVGLEAEVGAGIGCVQGHPAEASNSTQHPSFPAAEGGAEG